MMMLMIDTKMENAVMVITMITNHFKILHSQYKIYIVKVSSMALKMLTTLMLRAWALVYNRHMTHLQKTPIYRKHPYHTMT